MLGFLRKLFKKNVFLVGEDYVEITRRSFTNATMSEIDHYLRTNGMSEYVGYSRYYIVERMVQKAKENRRAYRVY